MVELRGLVQRVSRAEVRVDDAVVGAIGPGLCVLVGVGHDDDRSRAHKLAQRIWTLRIFGDDEGVMNASAADLGYEVLVISQFTLLADTSTGRRPSWRSAAPPKVAEPLVTAVVDELRALGATVATGRFQAYMAVELVNDGPATLLLET